MDDVKVDILDLSSYAVQQIPELYLKLGAIVFLSYLFGIGAAVALKFVGLLLLLTVAWPLLLGLLAEILLLGFSLARKKRYGNSSFSNYLMIPVVTSALYLLYLHKLGEETKPGAPEPDPEWV
jgi:hypothetical protein